MRLSIDYVSVVGGQRHIEGESRRLAVGKRPSKSTRNTLQLDSFRSKRCGIVVAQPQTRLRLKPAKGKLIVLAEPDLPGGVEAGSLVADWISAEFNDDPSSSIVTSLSNALHAVHRQLSKENLKSLSSERRNAAVVCASVRDEDIFLAQVGPSLALRYRDGRLGLIGQDFVPGPTTFAGCLGQDCEIEVRLAHEALKHGDVIILCTPSLIQIAAEREFIECFGREGPKDIADGLFHLHQFSLSPVDFAAIIMAGAKDLEVATKLRAPARDGNGRARSEGLSSHNAVEAKAGPAPRRSDAASQRPSIAPEYVDRRNRGERTRKLEIKRIALLGFLPLIILAFASSCAFLVLQDHEAKERQVQALPLLARMEESEREAQDAQNVMIKRRLLSQADDYAAQALGARPADTSLQAARERIRGDLDQLSNVVRLPSARRLVNLGQQAKDADPTRLIVRGTDVYILDRGSDRLYRYSFDASGEQLQTVANSVVARGRDRIGNTVVGHLVAMTWVPAGSQRIQPALVVTDDTGTVYEYDEIEGLVALRSNVRSWPSAIRALGGYAGSIYLLAPKSSQLIWFPPTPRGYDTEPFNYINPEVQIDLSTAVDFAIDASVFVLHSNGKVDRFTAGRPQEFDTSTPDVSLRSPTAIFASTSTKSVYIVDGSNQRVVQFSREGHFERQFRYGGPDNLFNSLRTVSVDEERGKLYFISDKKLFVADLPR